MFVAGINTFAISYPDTVIAGISFDITVNNAIDQYGNPTSGVVSVEVEYGGGISPNGVPPVYNDINVVDGGGYARQTLTKVKKTVLKCSAGGFEIFTDTLIVLPGAFGNLDLSGYPRNAIAGEPLSTDLTVIARDIFGNIGTDYNGVIEFSGAEILPLSYEFVPPHEGSHVFSGSDFIFEIAGARNIIVADTANSLADTSSAIIVYAASISSFALLSPDTVIAGESFVLEVINAVDQFSNPASGTVVISDSLGAGSSPNGTPPIFNEIPISINGSGNAEQVLTLTGIAILKGSASEGVVIRATDEITILPGILGNLDLSIASPQISSRVLEPISTITAKDNFGNLKYNFDASTDSVIIDCSTSGVVNPNVLKQASDFIAGVADLNDLGISYNGVGGQITFNAASQSDVYGESNSVNMVSLQADALVLDNNLVPREDTAKGYMRFTNFGSLVIEISDIDIYHDGYQFEPIFTPGLPRSFPAGADTSLDFSFFVPTGLAPGEYPLSMKITGNYSGTQVYDSLLNGDTLKVITTAELDYIENSLSPDTVSTDGEYSFTIRVHNSEGSSTINIDETTNIFFTDGDNEYRAQLIQNCSIAPDAEGNLAFEPYSVPYSFADGNHSIKLYIHGTDLTGEIYDSLTLSDSVLIETAADIVYNQNTLSPDSVLTGTNISFSVQVENAGQASLELNHNQTIISFSDGQHQFIALIDTASDVRIERIYTGDTTITFTSTTIPPGFIPGNYQPSIFIVGIQNQQEYLAHINTGGDSVNILSPGLIRMDSLYTVSINAPRVNTSQSFIIHGCIRNLGAEPLDSVTLLLETDGNSMFEDTLFVGTIWSDTGVSFEYDITADSLPNSSEIFHCSIIKAINSITGDSTQVAAALDNAASAIIELPPQFNIDTFYLSDDSLSTEQIFTVYALVNNSGGTSYSGSDQLTLSFDGDYGFQIADSSTRDFTPNQLLSWTVTAPESAAPLDSARVAFNGLFIDLNDSTSALGSDSIATAAVIVAEFASITHRASIYAPEGAIDGTLSNGQSFTVADSLFTAGNVGESFAKLTLPDGFNSADPLVQLLTGETITWHLNASQTTLVDSLRFDCWSFDSNTGDSVYDDAVYLPIEVVAKAALSIGLEITAPPSALDRTIMPGETFTLQALAANSGTAETGDGEVMLLFEASGFTVEEPAQSFTPGTPVEWQVAAPDSQILDGAQIAVEISAIPIDLNTGESAFVLNDSAGFDIIVKDELPDLVIQDLIPGGGAAVGGQPVDVYTFTLENTSDVPDNQIALMTFGFRLLSNDNLIAPGDIVSSSFIYLNGDTTDSYDAVIGDSLISFDFEPDIFIGPGSSIGMTINITPVENPAIASFNVSIDSDDIEARLVIGGIYGSPIEVILPEGGEFTLESPSLSILAADFESSFIVNNNPYLASNGSLEIGYYDTTDAVIDIAIYNINGEKVWGAQAQPSSGANGQYLGDYATTWDGRDSAGNRVLSGVYYILAANNSNGQTAKIKVAVIW